MRHLYALGTHARAAGAEDMRGVDTSGLGLVEPAHAQALVSDMLQWSATCPPARLACIDLHGIAFLGLLAAQIIDPQFLRQLTGPHALNGGALAYRMAPRLLAQMAAACDSLDTRPLAIVDPRPTPPQRHVTPLGQLDAGREVVLLGRCTSATAAILRLADERHAAGTPLTSADLETLPGIGERTPAARSKRLTDLAAARLLGEGPSAPSRYRTFIPAWRLPIAGGIDQRRSAAVAAELHIGQRSGCWYNASAALLSLDDLDELAGCVYVEGLAFGPNDAPFEHGWLEDTTGGDVIDPTWAMHYAEYGDIITPYTYVPAIRYDAGALAAGLDRTEGQLPLVDRPRMGSAWRNPMFVAAYEQAWDCSARRLDADSRARIHRVIQEGRAAPPAALAAVPA